MALRGANRNFHKTVTAGDADISIPKPTNKISNRANSIQGIAAGRNNNVGTTNWDAKRTSS